ncbi:translation initiation factor IF-2 [Streptomyces griseosporeus]|uniref:WXG100 family type VII secretion target n=1 Tax=Streptomyces griseosporeus TaxID=1910 RepID=UPI003701A282
MAGNGSGGATPFEGMSHEQMLAWLDQANSGTVEGAAGKLRKAATEIRSIAEELKIRPQWVEWKGVGADAFRVWAGDLANSAHRLADFSEDSAKWLHTAATAISQAQTSIPRDKPTATANLEAARANHNDPDATAVASKSTTELAALKANQEKVRLEAAAEMRKLAQSYDQSSTQMDKLERPKFPPPPPVIGPPVDGAKEIARPGTGESDSTRTGGGAARVGSSTGAVTGHASTPGHSSVDGGTGHTVPAETHRPLDVDRPTHVTIDSVHTLPETQRPSQGPGPTTGPTLPNRPEAGLPPSTTGMIPPMSGRGGRMPTGPGTSGKQGPGGRLPFAPTQGNPAAQRGRSISGGQFPHGPSGAQTGRTLPGQNMGRSLPSANGTTGRPTAPGLTGRPTTGPGMAGGRPTTGPGVTGGRPTGPGVTGGRPTGPGMAGGRPTTGPGVTGGRPTSPGVTGGRPTGPGTSGGHPSGPGAAGGRPTGPGAPNGRPTGPGMASGHPNSQGIVGGRQTSTPGSGTGRLPGGTVVGDESAANRSGASTGRPLATPQSGVVGGAPQQTGRAPSRPGAPVPSAPTRGGISGGTASDGGDRAGGRRAAGPASGSQQVKRQQSDRREKPSAAD